MSGFQWFCIAEGTVSLLTFLIYALDKNAAKKNLWRTPERRLLIMGFICGAVGGLLGMKVFHHKTRKWYFWAVNCIGLIWQLAAAVLLFLKQA